MVRPGSDGEHELQRRYGTEARARAFHQHQMLHDLNAEMKRFIGQMDMVFIATADSRGECDCSLRAGLPGFVRVLDDTHIIYPEYRGNGVMASLGNITENGHVGMFFADFFDSTIGLHVNGTASIIENDELLKLGTLPEKIPMDIATESGRKPERWVMVEVQEAYIHCSKHIPRLKKLDKAIRWGTDDVAYKGGNYFDIPKSRRHGPVSS